MEYGYRLAELRNKHGWTQEDLAVRLGVTRSALSHYEKTLREPNFETLVKLADMFGTTVDYLVGREAINYPLEHGKLSFSLDGVTLTPVELKRFIAFVRADRDINNSL